MQRDQLTATGQQAPACREGGMPWAAADPGPAPLADLGRGVRLLTADGRLGQAA